ncbi:MAG TPA: pyridoxamine 5'-phosphate oxidase family protein [Mycobacteriales bacterium]|nr:pyridoxamine 5'-phosphate oxidase family protein [Mycobacteriales bacterium]
MASSPRVLSVISDSECRVLLKLGEIGRVVVSVDALPAAFPVTYRVVDDAVVFRTGDGSKLSAALRHAVVAFEVDEIDPDRRVGWSVLVVGRAGLVTDREQIARLDKAGIDSWFTNAGPAYVRISVDRISGRRLDGTEPGERG